MGSSFPSVEDARHGTVAHGPSARVRVERRPGGGVVGDRSLLSRTRAGRSGHGWHALVVRRNARPDAHSTYGAAVDGLAVAAVRRTLADTLPDDDVGRMVLVSDAPGSGSCLRAADPDRAEAWRRLWGNVVPRRNPAIRAGKALVGTSSERVPVRMPVRMPPCTHRGSRAGPLAARRKRGCCVNLRAHTHEVPPVTPMVPSTGRGRP